MVKYLKIHSAHRPTNNGLDSTHELWTIQLWESEGVKFLEELCSDDWSKAECISVAKKIAKERDISEIEIENRQGKIIRQWRAWEA